MAGGDVFLVGMALRALADHGFFLAGIGAFPCMDVPVAIGAAEILIEGMEAAPEGPCNLLMTAPAVHRVRLFLAVAVGGDIPDAGVTARATIVAVHRNIETGVESPVIVTVRAALIRPGRRRYRCRRRRHNKATPHQKGGPQNDPNPETHGVSFFICPRRPSVFHASRQDSPAIAPSRRRASSRR